MCDAKVGRKTQTVITWDYSAPPFLPFSPPFQTRQVCEQCDRGVSALLIKSLAFSVVFTGLPNSTKDEEQGREKDIWASAERIFSKSSGGGVEL